MAEGIDQILSFIEAGTTPRLIPVRLRDLDAGSLGSTPIYLRKPGQDGVEEFHLYRSAGVPFTAAHSARLLASGTDTVYVPRRDEPAADEQAAPAAEGERPPEVERRRFARFPVWCPGRLVMHALAARERGEPRELPAQLFDVSRGGFGVLCKVAVERGTPVSLYLEAPGWEERPLATRVARCQERSGQYEIGLEIV